jgi:hypothetical protein
MSDKVKHVLAAKQTRNHTCHWIGCTAQVAPALWGCRKHWYMLPKSLRDKIWATYQIGQENDMKPSNDYIAVAEEVQEWISNFQKPV